MRTLATLTAAAALVAAFGFAGPAMAAHHVLLNGDAEAGTGDPANWNFDAVTVQSVTANASNNITGPFMGANFFSTGEAAIGVTSSASMDQDVNGANEGVWGCGVEGLEATYTVTAWAAEGIIADNAALVTTEFFDQFGNSLGGSNVPPVITAADTFFLGTDGPNTVKENAAAMNVELKGSTLNTATVADVGFDDVSVTLTGCLATFAKISGKVMGGGGQRGQWSFEGSVGILHDGDALVFSDPFHINYKTEGFSCDFTPTDLDFDGTTALVKASYVCTAPGPTNATVDAALIRLVPGTGGSEGPGKNKDRGDVCVDAIDTELNIGTSPCDDDTDAVALKNGNVHTDENTADGP